MRLLSIARRPRRRTALSRPQSRLLGCLQHRDAVRNLPIYGPSSFDNQIDRITVGHHLNDPVISSPEILNGLLHAILWVLELSVGLRLTSWANAPISRKSGRTAPLGDCDTLSPSSQSSA